MVTLGKGYYDFHFDSADDLRKIWAADTVNLKPDLLRLSQWTKRFQISGAKTDTCIALDPIGEVTARVLV